MLGFISLFVLFFVPAAVEGIGITTKYYIFLWTTLLIPTFLYLFALTTRSPIKIPLRLSIFVILFFLFSAISSFFYSHDKQSSVELLLLYVSLFLMFLFSYSNRERMEKIMPPLLFTLGVLFSAYSVLFHTALHEKQVVFATYGSHNHLGDYLGILLIMLISAKVWKSRPILILAGFIFFVLIIFSYSRSAYLGIFAVTVLFFVKSYRTLSRSLLVVGFVTLSFLLVAFSIVSSKGIPPASPLFPVQQYVIKECGLYPRDILSLRDDLFDQSIVSIQKYPVFGIGGGNFIKASKTPGPYVNHSDSAHNIFLEIAVEQGLPALLFFVLIFLTVIFHAIQKKDIWSYVILYILLNFLTDYTYKVNLFLILAAIVSGIGYEEKKSFRIPVWFYGMLSFILFFAVFLMLTSNFFLLIKKPALAFRWYPLNKHALIQTIKQEPDKEKTKRFMDKAYEIASDDAGILAAAAENHLRWGEKNEALRVYKKIYALNHYVALPVIKNIYLLTEELYGKEEAVKILIRISRNYENYVPFGSYKEEFEEFCIQTRGEKCWETGWYY